MTFTVIDTKTGQYPDTWEIACKEEWAKHLCYCDIEGFAVEEDGTLVLLDECGKVAYCPEGRFRIIPEPQWIPVTERLPDVFKHVLVNIPGVAPRARVKEAFRAKNGMWYSNGFRYSAEEITHWMPLPEPPKEGEA